MDFQKGLKFHLYIFSIFVSAIFVSTSVFQLNSQRDGIAIYTFSACMCFCTYGYFSRLLSFGIFQNQFSFFKPLFLRDCINQIVHPFIINPEAFSEMGFLSQA